MRDRTDVDTEQALEPPALIALFLCGGATLGVLALLSLIMGLEGVRGPTPRLGRMGYIWEGIFVAGTLVLAAGIASISAALRAVVPWMLASAAACALAVATIVAMARMAGAVDVLFPLANWVPGTVLISLWGWAASRAAVRQRRLPSAMSTAAAILAVLQAVVILMGIAVFGVYGGLNATLNLTAAMIVPAIVGGLAGWWICLGVFWRASRQKV